MPAGCYKIKAHPPRLELHDRAAAGSDGRKLFWPRGKLLGGSSSINAMIYMRGAAADYDEWAERTGDPSWSYEHVLPLFRRMEDNARGADAFHGVGGPLRVEDLRSPHPWTRAPSSSRPSPPATPATTTSTAPARGRGPVPGDAAAGRRWSSTDAYLHPARAAEPDGPDRRADHPRARRGRARDRRRVPLRRPGAHRARHPRGRAVRRRDQLAPAADALRYRPADHLREVGVDVVHDLPGVGGGLQDYRSCRSSGTCDRGSRCAWPSR